MKHKPYILNLDMMASIIRKAPNLNLISKKDRNEKALQIACAFLYANEPKMKETLELLIHCEEYHWLTHGKQVTFFDSTETARAIIESSYNIEDFSTLYNGDESFMLALPDDLKMGNTTAQSGIMVNIGMHSLRAENMVNPFSKWAKMPAPEIIWDEEQKPGDWGIYACYQQQLGSHEYMRFAFPSHTLPEIMKMRDFNDYRDYLKQTNRFDYFRGANLDAPEEAYQFDIIRLIAGLLLYRKALPDRIHPGMPGGFKEQAYQSRYVEQHKPQTIHSPATQANIAMGAHYRSWHFRQLMAERYYQGDYAKLRKGERIVFVRDSMVNREVEAETVT